MEKITYWGASFTTDYWVDELGRIFSTKKVHSENMKRRDQMGYEVMYERQILKWDLTEYVVLIDLSRSCYVHWWTVLNMAMNLWIP